MRLIHAALPALLLAFASPALADGIAVEGTGEVSAAPDTAFITSGVTTQGATAREALDANSEAMAALIEALTAAGIAERDIQTAGFSVNPNYVYSDARDEQGYSLPPRIDGYQVSNTVNVRVRDLDSLGQVLDESVTVGANTISGISFSVDDPSELYNQARRIAFEDAREKAELYADVAGETVGDLESISERQSVDSPQPMMMRQMAAESASDVPVQAGELTFAITVSVEWDFAD
jgi:uncharacterized protein YggE